MTIQLRRDTAANWTSVNPVLANGQPGYDTTNNILKIGSGVATWSALTAIGGGGVSDHGALTGLADDDHAQYHNDTRGDVRYYTKTLLDAGQLDTRYFTEAEVTSLLSGKFDEPTGDTTQYIAGDGSLITFPVAGQAGSLVRQVRNETGSTLTKGTVIYLLGASGNKPLAIKAIANSEASSDRTFGVIQADIANNANGYCVVSGDLGGLDTSALTEGAILYLSPTVAGGSTTTQPASPYHSVVLGVVTRSHATQGQVDVSIQNGFELSDIHDVSLTAIAADDFLTWNGSLWVNTQLATVALSNDYGDLDNIPSTFAPSAHSHAIADVTGLQTALDGKQPLATFGTVVFDFGTGAGTNVVQTVVSSASIGAGSKVELFLMGTDSTATHNTIEHQLLPLGGLSLQVISINAGVGFTAQAASMLRLTGTFTARWVWSD